MAPSKTATLTLRAEADIKQALQRAAEREHRSIANILEVLISEDCKVKGIATDVPTNNKRAEKGATS